MVLLLIKLLLSPLLVLLGSMAQRYLGQAVGGRVIGLPITSTPLLFMLALADGTHFAAAAAVATLGAFAAQASFNWAYAATATRNRVPLSVAAAFGAFAGVTALLMILPSDPLAAALLALGVIAVSLHFWPTAAAAPAPAASSPSAEGWQRLAMRLVLAGTFSFMLSQVAKPFGPHIAGIITAIPMISTVLFSLTHMENGSSAVIAFARGTQQGAYSVVASLFTLSVLLPSGHLMLAFALSVTAAAAAQGVEELAARAPALARRHVRV